MKITGKRGITLTELLVVVAISSIIMGIAGFQAQSYRERYQAEIQVREMHADMMKARARAFEQNHALFFTVTAVSYQITEDTNGSGGSLADAGDRIWIGPRKISYQPKWTGTIVMNPRGLISSSKGAILSSSPVAIRFDDHGADPEYDCLSVGPTRLNVGRWNGKKCAPR